MVIERELLYINRESKNNRIYTRSEVLPCIDKLLNKIKTDYVYGEFGHPEQYEISLAKACLRILDLWEKDNIIYGKLEILDNEYGRIVMNDLDQWVFRPRGAGTIDSTKSVKLEDIFTFDAIPIASDAWCRESIFKD